MVELVGFARILARARVEQQLNKSLFGKPYLKLGQCYVLGGYFFQLGGILGARYSACLDEFGLAFLGVDGKPGTAEEWLDETADELVPYWVNDLMKFSDYVGARLLANFSYKGDFSKFFLEHGGDKIAADISVKATWHYAREGAALGATYPHILKAMFERTHAKVPEASWERARAIGLDIPAEQEVTSYEGVEQDEDALFRVYCKECCPRVVSVLWPDGRSDAFADGNREDSERKIAIDEHCDQGAASIAAEADLQEATHLIGSDILWKDVARHVLRVREFDRQGTTVGPDDKVISSNMSLPYGYLLVDSPILIQRTRLPIIHRDDFLLATFVFDDPKFAHLVDEEELLVTYAPKRMWPNGKSASISHVLHYLLAPSGTLDSFYEDEDQVDNPCPESLFGQFVYKGSITVKIYRPEAKT